MSDLPNLVFLNLNINFVNYFTSVLLKSTFLVKIYDGNLRHLKSRPTIDW